MLAYHRWIPLQLLCHCTEHHIDTNCCFITWLPLSLLSLFLSRTPLATGITRVPRLALMNSINKVAHQPIHYVHSFQNKTLINSTVCTNAAGPDQFELLMTISEALAAALKHADPSITVSIKLPGTNGNSLLTFSPSLPKFTVSLHTHTHTLQ